jgi:hypothetical protein
VCYINQVFRVSQPLRFETYMTHLYLAMQTRDALQKCIYIFISSIRYSSPIVTAQGTGKRYAHYQMLLLFVLRLNDFMLTGRRGEANGRIC